MVSWESLQQSEPDFAGRVKHLFDQGRHKTIATLRADGAPRISGIECTFDSGELRFGSMALARKGADLRRDPRFALHSPTNAPEVGQEATWVGEAKIAGRAIPAGPSGTATDDQPDGEMFRADILSAVITGLTEDGKLLRVQLWTPAGALREMVRA